MSLTLHLFLTHTVSLSSYNSYKVSQTNTNDFSITDTQKYLSFSLNLSLSLSPSLFLSLPLSIKTQTNHRRSISNSSFQMEGNGSWSFIFPPSVLFYLPTLCSASLMFHLFSLSLTLSLSLSLSLTHTHTHFLSLSCSLKKISQVSIPISSPRIRDATNLSLSLSVMFSVTRLGEILSLWQKFQVLSRFLTVLFIIWQNAESSLANL